MERKIDKKMFRSVIIYGIGQYYKTIKPELFAQIKPDYLCDRKWDTDAPESFDGIPVISRENLYKLENSLVIISGGAPWTNESIRSDMAHIPGATVVHVDEIIGRQVNITGKMLKKMENKGYYEDFWGNRVEFDSTVPDTVSIIFRGRDNRMVIGSHVTAGSLTVGFGNGGVCVIGDRAEIMEAYIAVSGAKVMIGKDSLISTMVQIRNHDGHHMFDLETKKRINHPADVIIGDHVWIGYRAIILAGARIGAGSVIGAGAVTSGQFGGNLVIAGCPARVIRTGVCWSRDDTDYFNHESFAHVR